MIQPEYNEIGDLSGSAWFKVKLLCEVRSVLEVLDDSSFTNCRTVAALSLGTISLSEVFFHAHSLQFQQLVRVCCMTVKFCLAARA